MVNMSLSIQSMKEQKMTEIEEKFYRTFDIKPVTLKDFNYNTLYCDLKTICINGVRYPKITNRILLELICILTKYKRLEVASSLQINSYDIENLKYEILDITFWTLWFMQNDDRKERFKNEVRALFEEGAEDE